MMHQKYHKKSDILDLIDSSHDCACCHAFAARLSSQITSDKKAAYIRKYSGDSTPARSLKMR
jgi:hypothetical protein